MIKNVDNVRVFIDDETRKIAIEWKEEGLTEMFLLAPDVAWRVAVTLHQCACVLEEESKEREQ